MEHGKRLLQILQFIVILILVFYVVIHDVIINKTYLQTDTSMISTIIAKTKTVGSIENTQTIVDTVDIIYPSLETNALFITTSMIITPNQTRTTCIPSQKYAISCKVNTDCPTLNTYTLYPSPGVINTGICNTSLHLCTVQAWCPIENEYNKNRITNIGNGTIFLDIHAMFTSFDTIVSNTYNLNEKNAPKDGYNLFLIDDIVRNATNGKMNTNDILDTGMIILMIAEWNCDLDKDIKLCMPKFKYYRLDSQYDTITYGFNFRNVWYKHDNKMRMLMKRYGIRIVFMSIGTATKTAVNIVLIGVICLGIVALIMSIILTRYIFWITQFICVWWKDDTEIMDTFIHETDDIMSVNSSPSMVLEGRGTTLLGHVQSTQM
eukprot:454542_1